MKKVGKICWWIVKMYVKGTICLWAFIGSGTFIDICFKTHKTKGDSKKTQDRMIDDSIAAWKKLIKIISNRFIKS